MRNASRSNEKVVSDYPPKRKGGGVVEDGASVGVVVVVGRRVGAGSPDDRKVAQESVAPSNRKATNARTEGREVFNVRQPSVLEIRAGHT